jgi:hypothetical protein
MYIIPFAMHHIALSAIIAFIWGVFPWALKYASKSTPSDIILLVMSSVWFVSSCVYSTSVHGSVRNIWNAVQNIDTWVLTVTGLAAFFGIFLFFAIYIHVVDTSPRLNVAITIMSLSSVVSLIYACLFLNVVVPTQAIVGIVIAAIGVAIMLLAK